MKTIKFTHPALDEPIMVRASYVVCPQCYGHGTHERTDIDCSRLVDSMMEDGDNEGVESYMKGGYDTVCTECNGLRVVLNPVLPDHVQKEIDEYCRCEREDVAYAAQERRMMGV